MARSDDAQHDLDDLGALLRTQRKRAGLTGVEAARRAGFTQSKLSRIETGLLLPSPDDVRRLAAGLGMEADASARALELIDRLQDEHAARRVVLRRGVITEHTALLAKFGNAGYVVAADPVVVPDWLRTRDYLLAAAGPLSERNTEAATALLRRRQQMMATPGFRFEFYVFASALGTRVGSSRIMAEQTWELATISDRYPNVVLRVIHHKSELTPVLPHGFEVHDDRQAVLTLVPGVVVITSDNDVQPFRHIVSSLRKCAMNAEQSRAYLEHFSRAYDMDRQTGEKYAS
ncbi:Scr1 family TA system antitoxin-like transcriptional regulator [Lentzea flava]|uniref:Transcriptional regulator n=1 Tax=Lentzea flava TaxID=103732 RepID=A0ABQ2UUT4_9PSEU|nr:Scr1 family TA system antitoxin-like transcriptional regulator [Lentzea flava]MCP2201422.1 Helix-turn-helix domain-containing protein [Lentzea flava]GGU51164.1 transcriptional regulator [Lentzea flava]